VTVTTALYRRYRPDSFVDVIGQEHVTGPLMTALRKNRVNHAYLFSGPRGCGKTTSARILARCLNCAEGPTDTPCGVCPSCVELARGGAGSLDVIEIDAASHGGVDDARDLRERATYAPVRDRYKIFIIDEAHMVTSAGFNALLKIVEEPPEHIKFIFATTEPDKVIGTIRSRTHHYPFRLVPPEPLMAYLELLCRQENVPVAPGVLSLVIRAGGGSVRDSLSVLDQLMAGAGTSGLDYELAVALLGYTHASLLDDVIEAVAASDAATVFRAVDRVIQTGHDPRRFVEDLLERFRDLIIVKAMPESAQSILRGMPADQISRMQNQAHNLGAAELSRAADVTNTALTEMTGATSPRLHLELLCARILLPSSEQNERGTAARIDRVERRLNYAGNDVGAPAATSGPASAAPASAAPASPAPASAPAAPAAPAPRVGTVDSAADDPRPAGIASRPVERPAATAPATPGPAPAAAALSPAAAPSTAPIPAPASPAAAPAQATGPDVEMLRRAWPEILQTLSKIKRSTWALVEPNAQVGQIEGQVLILSFTTAGLAGAFGRADHAENLRQAIHKTIGIDCQITAVAGGDNTAASSEPSPKAPTSQRTGAASADAAWGLGPGVPAVPAVSAVHAPSAAAAAEPPLPSAAPAATVRDRQASEPDDDWGAPRDEDAPPLDEEPPMDWEPSATASVRSSAPNPAPATVPPTSVPVPEDPWARAVEQSPGVWTVGTEVNAQRDTFSGVPAESAGSPLAAGTSPYEPAAAQIPAPAGAFPSDGSGHNGSGNAGAPPPGLVAPAGPVITAAAAPVITAAAAPVAAVAPVGAPPASARQSLYQRLSNSPEAEAGRAKAPVRAVPSDHVQDVPSADDETIEASGVFGRAAVERILGGKLLEERSLDGSPLAPRF